MKLTQRSTATGVTLNQTFIHVVNTNDLSQDPAGSSYKAPLSLLSPLFTGGTGGGSFTGNTLATCINDLYVSNLYGCPDITINNFGTGTSVFSLGIDSNGTIVTATTTTPSFGVFGISDSTGSYTYYSTLQSAINAATTGDTIQMFADVTENSATTVILKDGVNLNMNGYTYTLNQSSSDNCLDDNNVAVNCKIYNGVISRSGSTYVNDTSSLCLYVQNSSSSIETSGVYFKTSSTTGINNAGTIKGAIVNAYTRGIVNSGKIYSTNAIATIDTGIYCSTTTSEVYDSIGRSESSGYGIGMLMPSLGGVLINSKGYSLAQAGIYTSNLNRMQSCVGYSAGNIGISSSASLIEDCKGYSSSSLGMSLQNVLFASNILGYSYSSIGLQVTVPTNGVYSSLQNVVAESISDIGSVLSATGTGILVVKNLQSSSGISSVSGYACQVSGNNNISIMGGSLSVRNSAECLYTTAPITVKYANLVLKTIASPAINSNITQGIVNSGDTQGNIII